MKLLQALRNATQRLAADFEDSKLFDHMGERGEFREEIIERFLKPFLPQSYGIGSGQVFSEDGGSSKQIDIVIYDTVFSNVLFRDKKNSLFPCESIYGTVEVKSQLSKEELIKSIDNIISVKILQRAASDMRDILPIRHIGIGDGLSFSPDKMNPYLGVIFAYDGLSAEKVADHLNHALFLVKRDNLPDSLPDFVFSYQKQYMIFRCKKRKHDNKFVPSVLGESTDRYAIHRLGSDTLPLFFLTLNTCSNNIFLKAPNFNNYWKQVFNDALRQRENQSVNTEIE